MQKWQLKDLLTSYREYREAQIELNNKLIQRMEQDPFMDAARRLAIERKGRTFIINDEYDMQVVADFCIHCETSGGKNLVERCLDQPDGFDKNEQIILSDLARSRYAVLLARKMEPGIGFYSEDLITGKELFLLDSFFSRTAPPGAFLAARIFPVDEFYMSTGAGLPLVGSELLEKVISIIDEYGVLASEEPRNTDIMLNERIVRTLLENNMSTRIAVGSFGENLDDVISRKHDEMEMAGRKILPNEPCPCGSGKKYKKCCRPSHF